MNSNGLGTRYLKVIITIKTATVAVKISEKVAFFNWNEDPPQSNLEHLKESTAAQSNTNSLGEHSGKQFPLISNSKKLNADSPKLICFIYSKNDVQMH